VPTRECSSELQEDIRRERFDCPDLPLSRARRPTRCTLIDQHGIFVTLAW